MHQIKAMGQAEARYQQDDLAAHGSPAAVVVKFHARLDSQLKLSQTQAHACKAGCSLCCNSRVMASASEVLAIASHMREKKPADWLKGMLQKLGDMAKVTAALGPEKHAYTNVPCAFLGEDQTCQIYDVRPLTCRRFHSLDLEACKRMFDGDPGSAKATAPLSADYLAVGDVFFVAHAHALKEAGRDTTLYELGAAVLDAVKSPDALKRWKAGKVTFPKVKDREA